MIGRFFEPNLWKKSSIDPWLSSPMSDGSVEVVVGDRHRFHFPPSRLGEDLFRHGGQRQIVIVRIGRWDREGVKRELPASAHEPGACGLKTDSVGCACSHALEDEKRCWAMSSDHPSSLCSQLMYRSLILAICSKPTMKPEGGACWGERAGLEVV